MGVVQSTLVHEGESIVRLRNIQDAEWCIECHNEGTRLTRSIAIPVEF